MTIPIIDLAKLTAQSIGNHDRRETQNFGATRYLVREVCDVNRVLAFVILVFNFLNRSSPAFELATFLGKLTHLCCLVRSILIFLLDQCGVQNAHWHLAILDNRLSMEAMSIHAKAHSSLPSALDAPPQLLEQQIQ